MHTRLNHLQTNKPVTEYASIWRLLLSSILNIVLNNKYTGLLKTFKIIDRKCNFTKLIIKNEKLQRKNAFKMCHYEFNNNSIP